VGCDKDEKDNFGKMLKSPKLASKIIYEFKKEGLEISDTLSLVSLFKKYYRNYWDTYAT